MLSGLSLLKCLLEPFERMVLSHLYGSKDLLSPKLFGLMHKMVVHHCTATFLSLHTEYNYNTFLELICALDVANQLV